MGGGYFAALLSRWVNVAIGAATIAATYALACRSLQGEHGRADSPDAGPRLALAAAAIVAFNPQFIYLSAAINNDVIAALAGAGILLASVIVIREGPSIRNLVALGVVSGLGLLAKLQVGALGIPVMLALVLAAWQSRDRTRWMRSMLRSLIVVGSAVLIVSGWWFWRNLRLYGEPTGLRMQQALWGGRSVATNLWAIWQGLPQVWASLWGQFGYGQIPLPSWMMTGLLVVVLICLGGYALRRPPVYDRRTIGLLAIAVLVAVAAVVIYTAAKPCWGYGTVPISCVAGPGRDHRWWAGTAVGTRRTDLPSCGWNDGELRGGCAGWISLAGCILPSPQRWRASCSSGWHHSRDSERHGARDRGERR